MRPRRRPIARHPIVPPATAEQFLTALRACCLLNEEQVRTLAGADSGGKPDLSRWAAELVRNAMLTPYQAELLLEGRGADLVLGPYRILDWLGAGGMGQVYKAQHALMRRVVALKVMAPEPSTAEERQARCQRQQITFPSPFLVPRAAFLREVQAAGQLFHPNIVTAFDAAEIDGLLVLVMEYVEGVDLERLVAESGPLPVALACEYVRQAALGLQHAHERGLVHGDVKPSNLLVAAPPSGGRQPLSGGRQPLSGGRQLLSGGRQPPESALRGLTPPAPKTDTPRSPGVVKLLDLGLARLAGRPREGAAVTAPQLGEGGQPTGLAGTPDYLAPELAHDVQQASVRSDLYGLGCTFYYLLTGQVPFPAGAWTEKLLRHQFDPAPLAARLRPDVPPAIDAVLQRLLAKAPADRFADAAAVAAVLQAWLAAPPAEAERKAAALLPEPELVESLALQEPAVHKGTEAASAWDITDAAATVDDRLGPSLAEAPSDPQGGASAAPAALEEERSAACPVAAVAVADAPSGERPGVRGLALGVFAAIGVGLTAAGLLRWGLAFGPDEIAADRRDAGPTKPPTAIEEKRASLPPAPPVNPFVNAASGTAFSSLAEAVAAARNGDTLVLHGDGPYLVPPLRWTGKALTLRAAAGAHPRLQYDPPHAGASAAPLLLTDRALHLEDIDLEWASERSGADGSAHLVYVEGGSLRLTGCVLRAPRGSAPVVVRRADRVELRDCRITCGALALAVEAGESACEVRLHNSAVRVENAGHAALSLWAAEGARTAPVHLYLEKNNLRADRVLALRNLSGGIEVAARGNEFRFRQALLSVATLPGQHAWQRTLTWRGESNVYQSSGNWVQANGAPAAVRSLEEWQALWGVPEPGSVEKPQPLAAR